MYFLIITTCEDQRISKEKQIDDMIPLLARLIFSCEEIQDRLGMFFFFSNSKFNLFTCKISTLDNQARKSEGDIFQTLGTFSNNCVFYL